MIVSKEGQREGGSKWKDQGVELRICPKGKGGAKNVAQLILDIWEEH